MDLHTITTNLTDLIEDYNNEIERINKALDDLLESHNKLYEEVIELQNNMNNKSNAPKEIYASKEFFIKSYDILLKRHNEYYLKYKKLTELLKCDIGYYFPQQNERINYITKEYEKYIKDFESIKSFHEDNVNVSKDVMITIIKRVTNSIHILIRLNTETDLILENDRIFEFYNKTYPMITNTNKKIEKLLIDDKQSQIKEYYKQQTKEDIK